MMRFNQFSKHPREEALKILGDRVSENMTTTLDTMKQAHDNEWGYRISSTLFPLFTLDEAQVSLDVLPNAAEIDQKLYDIQSFISGVSPQVFRVSFHPDHFNVLCSSNPEVVRRTVEGLEHHAWAMDRMAGENSRDYWHPLNIHMSRSTGDPEVIAKEFISNYNKLSHRVKSRLVLENEDKGVWTPDMLYELIYSETKIPITYDNLHHKCNPGKWDTRKAFSMCASTWREHDVNPLFHYSEGGANGNPRAHTDFATSNPKTFREQFDDYYTGLLDIDWDIEIKQKDYAIQNIQKAEEQTKETV
jgi:UV DNA damage endonuclease